MVGPVAAFLPNGWALVYRDVTCATANRIWAEVVQCIGALAGVLPIAGLPPFPASSERVRSWRTGASARHALPGLAEGGPSCAG